MRATLDRVTRVEIDGAAFALDDDGRCASEWQKAKVSHTITSPSYSEAAEAETP
jgi:hypothetical protein